MRPETAPRGEPGAEDILCAASRALGWIPGLIAPGLIARRWPDLYPRGDPPEALKPPGDMYPPSPYCEPANGEMCPVDTYPPGELYPYPDGLTRFVDSFADRTHHQTRRATRRTTTAPLAATTAMNVVRGSPPIVPSETVESSSPNLNVPGAHGGGVNWGARKIVERTLFVTGPTHRIDWPAVITNDIRTSHWSKLSIVTSKCTIDDPVAKSLGA